MQALIQIFLTDQWEKIREMKRQIIDQVWELKSLLYSVMKIYSLMFKSLFHQAKLHKTEEELKVASLKAEKG